MAHSSEGLSDRLTQASSLIRAAAHGAGSMVKTQVLRRDRVSLDVLQSRLDTCRHCPGGHATFNKRGELHTCGPMLQSMKDAGQKTCGCILNAKARDAKESCPFGYWPSPDVTQVQPRVSLPLLNSQAGQPIPSPSLFDPSRRRFIQGAAAMAGTLLLPRPSWARTEETEEDPTCWFQVKPCEGSGNKWLPCTKVQGHDVGDAFQSGEVCYTITSTSTETRPSSGDILGTAEFEADCPASCYGCEDPIGCGPCCFSSKSRIKVYLDIDMPPETYPCMNSLGQGGEHFTLPFGGYSSSGLFIWFGSAEPTTCFIDYPTGRYRVQKWIAATWSCIASMWMIQVGKEGADWVVHGGSPDGEWYGGPLDSHSISLEGDCCGAPESTDGYITGSITVLNGCCKNSTCVEGAADCETGLCEE